MEFISVPGQSRPTASSIHIETIQASSANWEIAQLFIRSGGPSDVALPHGLCEHMLFCSTGRKDTNRQVQSILRAEGRVYDWRQLPDQAITFIPAAYSFEWEWTYHSHSTHLIIPPSAFSQVAAELQADGSPTREVLPQFRIHDPLIADLLTRLNRELIGQGYGTLIAVDAMINLLLVHLLHAYSGRTLQPEPKWVGLSPTQRASIVTLIEERLDQNIRLHELARALYLSQYHFCRLFKSSFGVSPHEYQLQRRIERACDVLRTSRETTVSQVAASLGFTDESHFRRHFKRILGTTPRQYRGQSEDSQDRT